MTKKNKRKPYSAVVDDVLLRAAVVMSAEFISSAPVARPLAAHARHAPAARGMILHTYKFTNICHAPEARASPFTYRRTSCSRSTGYPITHLNTRK